VTVADSYFFRPGASQPSRFAGSLATTLTLTFTIADNPTASAQSSGNKLAAYGILIGFIGGPVLCCLLVVYGCYYRRAKHAQRRAAHFATEEFAKLGGLTEEQARALEDAIATGNHAALQRQASHMFSAKLHERAAALDEGQQLLVDQVDTGIVKGAASGFASMAGGLVGGLRARK